MMLTERIADDGFAIVEGVLQESSVQTLIDSIEHFFLNTSSLERHALRSPTAAIPAIAELANNSAVRDLIEKVFGPGAFLVRSLFFDKTPEANWNVAWHQDLMITVDQKVDDPEYGPWSLKNGVWHVQPPPAVLQNMLTARIHLDNCEQDNGPLRVLPASHTSGILSAEQIDAWRDRTSAVTCSVARGGVLLLRPLLLHASSRAKTPRHRRVIHLEFAAEPLPGNLHWLC